MSKIKSIIVTDFTADALKGYLNNDTCYPLVNAKITPFAQVMQSYFKRFPEFGKNKINFAVVWTRPEGVIESFMRFANYQSASINEILADVNEYCRFLIGLQDKVKLVFVPTWIFPTYHRGHGMLEMRKDLGIRNILMQMNLMLSDKLNETKNIYLLNAQRWIESVGSDAFDSKLWYLAKIPFDAAIFKEAAKDIKSALRGIFGVARKMIIVDLDNTIWGGSVGEIGWEKLKLGGHDPVGEAFVDFQRALKSFINRGILLGIVSKNEPSVVLDAINNHPEMCLRLNDFSAWAINWEDKAKNIIRLASNLNIGLESIVFIDDNPLERARVKESLPEVFVPEWPKNKMLFRETLLNLSCFDTPSITEEDLAKTRMYMSFISRKGQQIKMKSVNTWLKKLFIKVKIDELQDVDIERVTQLLNKTNQMNLTTRRLIASELDIWAHKRNHKLWTFRVSNKFGDLGLVGVVSLGINRKEGRIVDFVLSCRAFGLRIEEAMLIATIRYSQSVGLIKVQAKYISTPKNKPCLNFWRKTIFEFDKKRNIFFYSPGKTHYFPRYITIVDNRRSDPC